MKRTDKDVLERVLEDVVLNGKSLTRASRDNNTSVKTVLRYYGEVFSKDEKGNWRVNYDKLPVYLKPDDYLTPKEKEVREKSREIINRAKRGESLSKLAKEYHTSVKTVLKYTHAFYKEGKVWKVKDKIPMPRTMNLYENGRVVKVDVNHDNASLIGKFFNDVKKALATGDFSILEKWKNSPILDLYGNAHYPETNPETLYELEEQRAEKEEFEVYAK